MASDYDPTNNGGDPCSVFFNGFANTIKPSDVSTYFHDKGYNNRILYQRVQLQQFRLYLALKFENSETAKEVCEKWVTTFNVHRESLLHTSHWIKSISAKYLYPRIVFVAGNHFERTQFFAVSRMAGMYC